jgi:hypothetical protein
VTVTRLTSLPGERVIVCIKSHQVASGCTIVFLFNWFA